MNTISYPYGQAISFGESSSINQNIVWLRMPLPFILNHINIWLIKDTHGWCAIDTGVSNEVAQTLWEKWLTTFPLSRLIVTHYHSDHFGLAGWLQQKTAAPLAMAASEYFAGQLSQKQIGNFNASAMVHLLKIHGVGTQHLALLENYDSYYRNGCPIIPPTFTPIRRNDTITIANDQWQVITGAGHGIEQTTLYNASQHILIGGDMLLPSITTNLPVLPIAPNDDPIEKFLVAIDQYLSLPTDTLVLPSHGRPYIGLHARIKALHQYHDNRISQVHALCKEPQSAFDLVHHLFGREIQDATQCIFYTGEAIAILNHLHQKGLVQKIQENGLIKFTQ